MWFLFLQIFLLMALAAALGAALMFWWMRRQYEDVTEAYEKLSGGRALSGGAASGGLTIDLLRAELAQFRSTLPAPQTIDLDPIMTDLRALKSDIIQVEAGGDPVDFEPVLQLMSDVETALERNRQSMTETVSPLQQRVAQIEALLNQRFAEMTRMISQPPAAPAVAAPSLDLQPMETRLGQLDTKLDELTRSSGLSQAFVKDYQTRMTALAQSVTDLQGRLGVISDAVSTHKGLPDNFAADYTARMNAITVALSGLQDKLGDVEVATSQIDTTIDLEPLTKRVDEARAIMVSLRPELQGLNALSTIDNTLSDLRGIVFNLRDNDIQGLSKSLRQIDSRLDMVGVENRLTAIEYGMAATHHMVRSRLSEMVAVPPAPQQEPFRSGPPKEHKVAGVTERKKPAEFLDPIDIIRHPDNRANLLLEPGFGPADNLEQISGIGPVLRQQLNEMGIYYFWQIADWSEDDVDYIDARLENYRGAVSRHNWQKQAKALLESPNAAIRPTSFDD